MEVSTKPAAADIHHADEHNVLLGMYFDGRDVPGNLAPQVAPQHPALKLRRGGNGADTGVVE